PQTAMSAAALVFVFGAGQVALLIAAGVVAFGFRIRRAAPERATPAAPVIERDLAPVLSSRAERLAFDLLRDQTYLDARPRPMQPPAALAPRAAAGPVPPDLPTDRPARLGDAYRRPGVTTRPETRA